MIWYLLGALTLLVFVVPVLVPWTTNIGLSAEQGFRLRLKMGKVIPVVVAHKAWGQQAEVSIMGLKMPPGSKHGRISGNRWAAILQAGDIRTLKKINRYLHALAGHTKMKLEISGEFGFGDPALTGFAYGMACTLIGAWGVRQADIKPNFFEPIISGEIKLAGTFVPLVVIMRTLVTAFHPSVMRVLVALAGFGQVTNNEGGRKVGS